VVSRPASVTYRPWPTTLATAWEAAGGVVVPGSAPGTSDLVTNNRIINVGNLNLFLATVNWAVDRDTQLAIPARPIQRFQLALSAEELGHLRLILLFGLPGCIALIGIAVYWTRRN